MVHTVRMNRGARGPARMEEPASETLPTHTSTVVTVLLTSLEDTVRKTSDPALRPAPICSVNSIQGIRFVMTSVTTMNVSGMEETAH